MSRPDCSRVVAAVRPFTHKGAGHWIRFVLVGIVSFYVGHLLSEAPWLTQLRYRLYGVQMRVLYHDRYPQRTALVLLDDDDYWGEQFQARSPLKRTALAALVDRLNLAGVNTMALDVDLRSPLPKQPGFEFPDYLEEDSELLSALEDMCARGRHVVLASSIRFDGEGYHEMQSIYTGALPRMPCVQRGYIQLPFDMRRIPGSLDLAEGGNLDSLSLAVTSVADPTAHTKQTANQEKGFRFSEYLTAANFAPRDGRQFIFSGQQLMEMKPEELRGQLADKLVFVGANWHANAYGSGPLVDMHDSPGGLEPGVMLHANYVEAMLDRTGTFAPMNDTTARVLEFALALGLALVGSMEIHTAWKWVAFAVGCVLSMVVTYSLLQDLGLFLDFLVPFLMLIFGTIAEEFGGMASELRHARLKLSAIPSEVAK
jgi:CHASE2 domain-containing sensor protein